MRNKRKENSVRSLVSLYTVVIGVALSLAVVSLVGKDGLKSTSLYSFLLFVAFIATLFPFYHGALRHLDDAYIENDNAHIKSGALVFDFILLFVHALAFVVLSLLLSQPSHFGWVLVILLGIDVAWGIFAYFAASSPHHMAAETKWAIINFVAVSILVVYLVTNSVRFQQVADPLKLTVILVVVALLRTLADYVWCSKFYFPEMPEACPRNGNESEGELITRHGSN